MDRDRVGVRPEGRVRRGCLLVVLGWALAWVAIAGLLRWLGG